MEVVEVFGAGGPPLGRFRVCRTFFARLRGLMFRRTLPEDGLLFVLPPGRPGDIHSFFVFFPFAAVWTDGEGRVLRVVEVRPFRLVRARVPAAYLLEGRPALAAQLRPGDRLSFRPLGSP